MGPCEEFVAWESDVARAVSQWLGGGRWEGGVRRKGRGAADGDGGGGDDIDIGDAASSSGTSCSSEDWRISDWLPPCAEEGWAEGADGSRSGEGGINVDDHDSAAAAAASATSTCLRCAGWMEMEREMEAESEEWRVEIARVNPPTQENTLLDHPPLSVNREYIFPKSRSDQFSSV